MKRTSRYCNSFFKLFRNVILVITITIVITFCRICWSGNITKGGVSEPLRFLSLNAPMSFSATTSSKIIIFHFTFRCYKRRTLQRSYINHNSTCCKYVLIQAHLLLSQIHEVTGEKLSKSNEKWKVYLLFVFSFFSGVTFHIHRDFVTLLKAEQSTTPLQWRKIRRTWLQIEKERNSKRRIMNSIVHNKQHAA